MKIVENAPRREVLNFALAMEDKLVANDYRGHWYRTEVEWLVKRLKEEVAEMEKALALKKPAIDVLYECADVANFAMMIADNYGGQKTGGDYL